VTSYSAIITGFVRRPCSMSLASNHADASQGFTARAFFVDSTKPYGCGELSPCSTRLRLFGWFW
jgi:hypothetical protein